MVMKVLVLVVSMLVNMIMMLSFILRLLPLSIRMDIVDVVIIICHPHLNLLEFNNFNNGWFLI